MYTIIARDGEFKYKLTFKTREEAQDKFYQLTHTKDEIWLNDTDGSVLNYFIKI